MNIEEVKARNKLAFEGDHDDLEQLIGIHKSTYENLCASQNDVNALIAEVERLTAENVTLTDTARQNYCKFVRQQEENTTLKKDKEFCLNTAKCNAEFYDETKNENAMLKKALELAESTLDRIYDTSGEFADECIEEYHEAKEQLTHETHGEAEK